MADLNNYVLTPGNPPNHTIAGTLVDSSTGAVIRDFTGSKALAFPAVLGTLTPAQLDQLVQMIAPSVLQMKAGL